MSRALDYLARERPEAIGHYLAFLKANGQRLDPRTRNLISVITKVYSQTERGLRQYVRRTIREGSSADEIVDALMMAFPALGLSRILWAIDILLDMGVLADADDAGPKPEPPAAVPAAAAAAPAGAPTAADAADHWQVAAWSRELVPGVPRAIGIAGRTVLLTRFEDGAISAFDARCPHLSAPIVPDSGPAGHFTCARHKRVFDARSGHCVQGGEETLRGYAVREVDDRIEVRITLP